MNLLLAYLFSIALIHAVAILGASFCESVKGH